MNATSLFPDTKPLADRRPALAPTAAVADLRRLLAALDEALEMSPAERKAWLAMLQAGQPEMGRRFAALLQADAGGAGGAGLLERGAVRALGFDTTATHVPAAGALVGPYRLQREIGSGGMGRVWLAVRDDARAEDGTAAAAQPVALKLPLLTLQREALLRRFERERDLLAALDHPRIARLLDAGVTADGQPYLAMQFVSGRAIDAHCREQALGLAARLRVAMQVLGAVQHAHERGIVHRDIKPSNVLVTRSGRAMLLDFGIARLMTPVAAAGAVPDLTQEFGRVLSLHHAAPEQVAGGATGVVTDVWSLGVLLYELVAGRRPFPGASRGEIEHAILHHTPPPPTAGLLPAARGAAVAALRDLDRIVLAALQKNGARRPRSVTALRLALARWLRQIPANVAACLPDGAEARGLA